MKKLLFTGLLGLGLLLPVKISASTTGTSSTKEFFKNPGKGKTKTNKKSKSNKSSYASVRSYLSSTSKGCTYKGNELHVGKKGGCFYYSGNSKKYVDRSYCANCK